MSLQYTKRRTRVAVRFPNAIRDYRVRAGLSQRRLGELTGHRRDIISSWERGRCLPQVTNLFSLARTLNTLAEALYWNLYRPETKKKKLTTSH